MNFEDVITPALPPIDRRTIRKETQVTLKEIMAAADGPRYKALGNSWAVPNVRWLGERIEAVALVKKAQAAINSVAVMEAA
jgi:hypothetical protein